jgi:hypothetical protein
VDDSPDPYLEAAATIGSALVPLILAPSAWTHRRVETVDVLTFELVRRHVSVDFTVPAGLREQLSIPGTSQFVVPLATLRKEPLRHFDLRDELGGAVPVLGREHDGALAWAALLWAASNVAGIGELAPRVIDRLRLIATARGEEVRTLLDDFYADAAGDEQLALLAADDSMRLLLADLAENYVLAGVLDDVGRRRVLKYSYDSFHAPAASTWRRRLGWEPLVIELDVPSATRAASFHAEVVMPEELRSDVAFVLDAATGDVLGADYDSDRVAIHAPSAPAASKPRLVVAVATERAGFASAALGVAALAAGLLLLGALADDLSAVTAGPPLSILLAGSAVFAGSVARAGEHRVVSAMLLGPRVALLAVAVAALVAAAVLAFDLGRDAVVWGWRGAACVGVLGTAVLARFWQVSRPGIRRPD